VSGRDETPRPARFVVGIDLGTTNSALAFVDSSRSPWRVESFRVVQATGPAESEALDVLPSFHYEPAPGEFPGDALRLPWQPAAAGWIVGAFARDHGARVPGRLVTSAKSWLCHGGVDRTAALLPWHGAPDVTKVSPVEVSSRNVAHARAAWDHAHPAAPLAEQDVVVTVPASFDEIARELTVRAVREAGLPRVTLIEEPQAAFYAWIAHRGDAWRDDVAPGETALVIDVGGGTTDLTLIEVRSHATDGVALHRVAVGEHLILGGDNLDLALAHHVERKLGGEPLDPGSWSVLVRICQRVKEELLGPGAPQSSTLHVPGTGSRLIGGGRTVDLSADEVREVLLDGFFPRVGLDERPETRPIGFQEFGLPYAADPAVTRHLAEFLSKQGEVPVRPDLLLFNGGLFESPAIRERTLEVLASWFRDRDRAAPPRVLEHDRLSLAVARGAAYYGMVRRGEGVRIASGLARSYWVGVEREEGAQAAMCLVPAGLEEGSGVELDREFELRLRQPVEFGLFTSGARTTDRPGDLVDVDPGELRALPPIRTVLRVGKQAKRDTTRVRLACRLTEIGTLETRCREVEGERSWKLDFDVRSATRTDVAGHTGAGERAGVLDEGAVGIANGVLREVFAPDARTAAIPPERLVRVLEERLELERDAWPPALLRSMWGELLSLETGRRRGVTHEARWLNLTGFALRPGYGFALDDWRVSETWKLAPRGLVHDNNEACRAEWWILWRRVAGGLTAGQQRALAEPLVSALRGRARDGKPKKGSGPAGFRGGSHETAEAWRLLGSLEWLEVTAKVELGRTILREIGERGPRAASGAGVWALGRIGSRVPQYGPLNTVTPPDETARWVESLVAHEPSDDTLPFAIVQLARRTGDRYRDLPSSTRDTALAWMERHAVAPRYHTLVRDGGALEAEEQLRAFGESLPAGIRLL
jgi:hypothetical protein